MIQSVQGDIFLTGAQTIGHGCNCRGLMGKGIALEIRRRFPQAFEGYRQRCRTGRFTVGSFHLECSTQPWILNLATQADIGAAQLSDIRLALAVIADTYSVLGITSLALPRIGCGIGRVPWDQVKTVLEDLFGCSALPVVVYETFLPGVPAKETVLERR